MARGSLRMPVIPRTLLSAAIALGLSACASSVADPLTAPISHPFEGAFGQPEAARHVFGQTWTVGSSSLNLALIDTGAGLVLVDAGLPQWAPAIQRHMAAAGFDIGDVKYIFSTEPHYDHAAGLAALARASGAQVVASPDAARALRAGRSFEDDPQLRELVSYPPVINVREITDGQTITLGDTRITAHATPGHTPGSTSWSWTDCALEDCRTIVFASSMTPLTDGHYRHSSPEHTAALAAFRQGLAAMRALDCDILIPAHKAHAPGRESEAADFTPQPCAQYANRNEEKLEAQLVSER